MIRSPSRVTGHGAILDLGRPLGNTDPVRNGTGFLHSSLGLARRVAVPEDVPFVVELRDGGPGVDGQARVSIVAFLVGV